MSKKTAIDSEALNVEITEKGKVKRFFFPSLNVSIEAKDLESAQKILKEYVL